MPSRPVPSGWRRNRHHKKPRSEIFSSVLAPGPNIMGSARDPMAGPRRPLHLAPRCSPRSFSCTLRTMWRSARTRAGWTEPAQGSRSRMESALKYQGFSRHPLSLILRVFCGISQVYTTSRALTRNACFGPLSSALWVSQIVCVHARTREIAGV